MRASFMCSAKPQLAEISIKKIQNTHLLCLPAEVLKHITEHAQRFCKYMCEIWKGEFIKSKTTSLYPWIKCGDCSNWWECSLFLVWVQTLSIQMLYLLFITISVSVSPKWQNTDLHLVTFRGHCCKRLHL